MEIQSSALEPSTLEPLEGGLLHSGMLAIATMQFEVMVAFYQRLLNQAPQPFQAERYAEFLLPGLCLALFVPKPEQQAEFSDPAHSPVSLCLKIRDLPLAIAQVQAIEGELGIDCQVGAIVTASHGQELYIYDPQGNRIILYQPLQFF